MSLLRGPWDHWLKVEKFIEENYEIPSWVLGTFYFSLFFQLSFAFESVTATLRPLAKRGKIYWRKLRNTILGPQDLWDLLLFNFSRHLWLVNLSPGPWDHYLKGEIFLKKITKYYLGTFENFFFSFFFNISLGCEFVTETLRPLANRGKIYWRKLRNSISEPQDLWDLLLFNFFKTSLTSESVTGTLRPLPKWWTFFEENY